MLEEGLKNVLHKGESYLWWLERWRRGSIISQVAKETTWCCMLGRLFSWELHCIIELDGWVSIKIKRNESDLRSSSTSTNATISNIDCCDNIGDFRKSLGKSGLHSPLAIQRYGQPPRIEGSPM